MPKRSFITLSGGTSRWSCSCGGQHRVVLGEGVVVDVDDVLHLALPGGGEHGKEAPLAWRCRLRPFMSRHAGVVDDDRA